MHSVSNYVLAVLPALAQPTLIIMLLGPNLMFYRAESLLYSTPTRHLGTSRYI